MGTLGWQGPSEGPGAEVVSSAGRKNNEKGSEKSPTYFTYSTILLFKESSPAGVCSGGFPGENFKILDSM